MDNEDRQRILNNLELLANDTKNFDEVFKRLVQKGMFNDFMKTEILKHPDRWKFFYEYVTTRGPDAFNQLVNVLTRTDNGHIAAFLIDGKIRGSKVLQNGYGSNHLTLDEEFPHDPNVVWKVRKGIERYDLNKEEVYKMGSNPKGLVLIINIREFVNGTREVRLGSEHDIKRLRETFEQIGYQVTVMDENLKADDIKKAVKKFAQRDEHWECDSCIVIMMSHGTFHPATTHTVNFQAWDLKTVNSEDIITQFHGNKCRALVGKPKLFFFQACRGEQLNFTVPRVTESEQESRLFKKELNNDNENENEELKSKFGDLTITAIPEICQKNKAESAIGAMNAQVHPLSENCTDNRQTTDNNNENQLMNGNGCGNILINGNSSGTQLMIDSGLKKESFASGDHISNDADILIGFSTTPGNVSRRDPNTGSWFIQILCQMIAKHSWNKDVSTILEHTDAEMRKKTDCGTVQTPEVVRILTKKLYIHPGIYDDD